ncbi:MAG: hypothetical protein PHW87_12235 [Methanothrix sp.]|nr:hypothetical protein [Methanothrix sp.]
MPSRFCNQFGPALNQRSQQKRRALARQKTRAVLMAANHGCDVLSSERVPDFAVVKAEDGGCIDVRAWFKANCSLHLRALI